MIRPIRARTAHAGSRPRASGAPAVAYLVSQYPALSHTFIEREIFALRDLGVDVHTFTVRPAPADAPFAPASRAEVGRTTSLLGGPLRDYAAAHAACLLTTPRAWLAGLGAALRSGPPRPRARVWQLFYFAEAVVLVSELRRRGLTHVHVHFANNGADVARLAVTVGRAVDGPDAGWRWTFAMHGPTEFADVVGHDLAQKVRSADAVACISEYARGELAALVEPEHWPKLRIVRMSVSGESYPPMAAQRTAHEDGPLRVLFVGRLVEEKGPDVLVDAVHRLRAAGADVTAAIIGQGPLDGPLHEQVDRLGLGEHVRLVGPIGQAELPDWYLWADVFCLPSYAEGVPVVLMEAMSTELPVVTTRIAGIPELVEDGVSGVLVEPGRADEVAAALTRISGSPDVRREMGSRGRQRVVQLFEPETNARLLVDAIGLGEPSRPPTPAHGDR